MISRSSYIARDRVSRVRYVYPTSSYPLLEPVVPAQLSPAQRFNVELYTKAQLLWFRYPGKRVRSIIELRILRGGEWTTGWMTWWDRISMTSDRYIELNWASLIRHESPKRGFRMCLCVLAIECNRLFVECFRGVRPRLATVSNQNSTEIYEVESQRSVN